MKNLTEGENRRHDADEFFAEIFDEDFLREADEEYQRIKESVETTKEETKGEKLVCSSCHLACDQEPYVCDSFVCLHSDGDFGKNIYRHVKLRTAPSWCPLETAKEVLK